MELRNIPDTPHRPVCEIANAKEHLQEFAKSTWHPHLFGKIRKIVLQQLGFPTWHFF